MRGMNKPKRSGNQVRIIAGDLRRRILRFPSVAGLRPTSDRIRETLFNWVQQEVAGARVLDLFAGSGALGVEALSRGAAHVDLVEQDQVVSRALRDNLQALAGAVPGDYVLHPISAARFLQQVAAQSAKYDLVFLDPPYNLQLLPQICMSLEQAQILQPDARIYLEMSDDKPDFVPDSWEPLRQGRAGQVTYLLFKKLPT